ncbi:MAG: NAD(P)/FAD-dependent oxidoreductase [Kofleriaceae bacterium]
MYDVAIIGGGPAGLAAALALVRSRKRVVLFDCWPPRNAAATEIRGFVTQDGTPPAEMRQIARDQLAAYPSFALRDDTAVRSVDGTCGRFEVAFDGGSIGARRVLLCVGLVDVLPTLPGYRELWGTSVFQCPHCHAWEVRDRAFGYLAPDEHCADWSLLLRAWTRDLIVFTNGNFEPPPALVAELETAHVRLEQRKLAGFRIAAGKLAEVRLADGTEVVRDVMFVRPPQRQTELVAGLGLALVSRDLVKTSDSFETSIRGIYAAGDLQTHTHGALVAAANGAFAAHALDEELTRELVLAGAL